MIHRRKGRIRALLARRWAASVLTLALLLPWMAGPGAAQPTLLVMEPEIDGDLYPDGPAAWTELLDLLEAFVSEEVEARGVYTVVDSGLAERTFALHRLRADVYACTPCAVRSGEEAGAERVLSLWVYRASELILSMKAIIRDTDTGAVRYSTAYDFRGDNETAWLHAAERLVRGIEAIPPDLR